MRAIRGVWLTAADPDPDFGYRFEWGLKDRRRAAKTADIASGPDPSERAAEQPRQTAAA